MAPNRSAFERNADRLEIAGSRRATIFSSACSGRVGRFFAFGFLVRLGEFKVSLRMPIVQAHLRYVAPCRKFYGNPYGELEVGLVVF